MTNSSHGTRPETFAMCAGEAGADAVPVFQLSGPLDADGAPILADGLETLLSQGVTLARLDLHDLSFLSSAGVGCLISMIGLFRDKGGDLILERSSAEVAHVFELLCLQDYVTTSDGVETPS